ncbi:MAG: argininosuccinate lyase [Candidatus Marinimicrobia bacterium]|jgi:argininosuccinate lyase|nr:argininosuccinate lyase [Candidatus Neomarinimicrobiota bacterium]MDP6611531.1 argininosuccinate lyase [Candidatus Neomarinimicrobiota bacterium]|tara:strand:- start:2356 stop:3546 length:1191 start_codon:yes stop_codon:yes gene_type:complete
MSKLWEKGVSLDKAIESFTVGKDPELDLVLVPYDCKASKAHAKMLGLKGYLTGKEVDQLSSALDQIIQRYKEGDFSILVSQEDSQTAIEEYLVDTLGEVGKKIHMARSRNDQVLTALRLYYKDELSEIKSLATALTEGLDRFAEENKGVEFPGYTHMQKAMPSSIHMWACAYADSMKDDVKSLTMVLSLVDQSPLGSAAGYGVPIDIDQQMTAEAMGFSKVQENPIYCQLSRGKFELALLQTLSQVLLTINRLASDLIQFSMAEFGYFSLPEEFYTGSSIMPQKKNPDVLELLRGSYHILLGYETQVKTLTSNLISGYNRDIQLSKEPVMRSINLAKDCLGISAAVISGLSINKDKCLAAMTSELYATEKAYEMVKGGIPFREAYRKVAESLRKGD